MADRQKIQITKSVIKNRKNRTMCLPDEVQDRFLYAVRNGMSEDRAIGLLGLSRGHYYNRKALAKAYLNNLDDSDVAAPVTPNIERWGEFIEKVERAKSEHELILIENSLTPDAQNKRDWVRDVTILERRNRADWGKNQNINSGEDSGYDSAEQFL